jgi:hypothetical protein
MLEVYIKANGITASPRRYKGGRYPDAVDVPFLRAPNRDMIRREYWHVITAFITNRGVYESTNLAYGSHLPYN